jgi:hypothetical protein
MPGELSGSFKDLTCLHRPKHEIQLVTVDLDVTRKLEVSLLDFQIAFSG